MKAITFQAPEVVRCDDVPHPTLSGPRSAVVEVAVAGICGSDLHAYHGREIGLDAGTVMGHEFVGRITELGPSVRGLTIGAWVVGPFTTNCGECFYCRLGNTARCEHGQLFGWVENGIGLQGAQAEALEVPFADSTLVTLPETVPRELALFAGDVLPTGLFAAQSAQVTTGTTVAIVGCGPVGLMAVLACRHLGATRIFALDRVPERLDFASRLGAEPINIDAVAAAEVIREATDGRGADAVLEVVGSPGATRLAFDSLRPGGHLAAVGVHTEPHLAFSPGEAYDKNLSYHAGRCPARAYLPQALELLGRYQDDLLPLITHRLPLSEGVRGYRLFAERREGCAKVVLLNS